jgi:hypothetical protein
MAMFTVRKTLAKTVEYKFNNLRELHDWAAANRYNKARNVVVISGNGETVLDVGSIHEVYSYTLSKIVEIIA